ncbi:ABC transporter substrate-binding protein [Amylibacter kogurei]|uniref:ABC transporter substrate-binding protein n=1 Tax=Paramylibacter kogurei TaxID=1889778 RepID=A0A2G5KAK2_9RHOB|nr:ABC transporter substrate-binding protein [Amylibacter kogurei]PIB26063.1 ABC transporter substrate-binding protein [Amylibacter kogurei]
MRIPYFAAWLIAFITCGSLTIAFETEQQKFYNSSAGTSVLRIISTADISSFEPILLAFQADNPTIDIDYVVASSAQTMQAIYDEQAPFDLVISSAMDLQTKLANDGFAQTYVSSTTDSLPTWAKWRNQVFAFTQEPAVLVVSEKAFRDLPIPNTREELIELLRDNPQKFWGRVGTYDVRTSGFGYMLATQNSRNTDSFWRLTEVMGRLNTRLYCCSGEMIDDVAAGRLAMAYNVLGSYAENRLKTLDGVKIVPMQDFVSLMLRTSIITTNAQNASGAKRMVDFLSMMETRPELSAASGLPAVQRQETTAAKGLRPIRLGPGLLVFLDRLKRETFIRNWQNSIVQNNPL